VSVFALPMPVLLSEKFIKK